MHSQKGRVDDDIQKVLHSARKGALSLKETEILLKKIPDTDAKRKLLNVLLPEPENLNSKGIFSEIGRLSLLGAIPVIGGVLGGIAADRITKTSDKNSTANKIKEGFYQYFANIFLCNVGACAALFIAEGFQKAGKIKPLSPLKKMAVILYEFPMRTISIGFLGQFIFIERISRFQINTSASVIQKPAEKSETSCP